MVYKPELRAVQSVLTTTGVVEGRWEGRDWKDPLADFIGEDAANDLVPSQRAVISAAVNANGYGVRKVADALRSDSRIGGSIVPLLLHRLKRSDHLRYHPPQRGRRTEEQQLAWARRAFQAHHDAYGDAGAAFEDCLEYASDYAAVAVRGPLDASDIRDALRAELDGTRTHDEPATSDQAARWKAIMDLVAILPRDHPLREAVRAYCTPEDRSEEEALEILARLEALADA